MAFTDTALLSGTPYSNAFIAHKRHTRVRPL